MKKKIFVIIPAFNEEQSVGEVVRQVLAAKSISRCVVIDDGSIDRTASIATFFGADVLTNNKNRGPGSSIRKGLRFAIGNNADVVVLLDADGQHNPKYLTQILCALENGVDYVIASRYIHKTQHCTSLIRRIGTRIISQLIYTKYGQKVYDPTSGYRAMNKKTLEYLVGIPLTIFPEPDAVIGLVKNRYKIKEISTEMKRRRFGPSTINIRKACVLMGYIIYRIFRDSI